MRYFRRSRALNRFKWQRKEFGAGSTFALPAGFKGTWETLEPVKKIYVIWQAK